MSLWRPVGSVIAGAIATIVLGVVTIVLLPFLGFATAEVVGNWLPIWVFAVPLAICPVAGGAITGFLHGKNWKSAAILGCLAAASSVAIFGVVFGLLFLVLLLGMTPAHGQMTDLSKAALTMAAVGGGSGFVAGTVLGAIGGLGGHLGRQKLDL